MSLLASLRGGVNAVRLASRSVAVSITHEHWITRNSSGRITYLYIDERTAIVEPYEQIYRSADGSSLAVKSRVTFLEFVEITTSDRLTLPGARTTDGANSIGRVSCRGSVYDLFRIGVAPPVPPPHRASTR